MDDHNLLEAQVIYMEEDIVLDGKEIQYVIPQAIGGKNTNMLVQEDGTSFTHYLLNTEGVATMDDKNHIVLQQAEYSDANETSNTPSDGENQILQYNLQDEDVVAQVILTEEQCRILQDFGRVVINQGSRKFLLDGEGLKEVDPSYDCQNVECILSENDSCNETTNNLASSANQESDDQVLKGDGEDDDDEEEKIEEYNIDPDDNKESVFEFLRDRCDVVMGTTGNIEGERTRESIFAENLPVIETVEGNNSSQEENKQYDEVAPNATVKRVVASSVRLLNKKCDTTPVTLNINRKQQATSEGQKKKDLTLQRSGRPLTQIRGGKIVMMPEDAHTPYVKKLIQTHFANTKNSKSSVKLQVLKNQCQKTSKPSKLTLKNLKDYKIYIASTEDGKNIYGKIIDIIKPTQVTNNLKKPSVKVNESTVNNDDFSLNSSQDDTNNDNAESNQTIDVDEVEVVNPKSNTKYVTFSIAGKNISVPTNAATNLNKIISEKEVKKNMSANSNECRLSISLPVGSSQSSASCTLVASPDSSNNTSDWKYAAMPFESESDATKIIEPSDDELEKLNGIFSKLAQSQKVASCLTCRDILIIKEMGNGTSEMFTGRINDADKIEDSWRFTYMPELWYNTQGSANKKNVLKNGNFLVLKLIKNDSTDTTDIIIMDKAKYPWKQMEETTVNNAKHIRKTLYCPYCKKTFYRGSCLSRHMAIHTNQHVGYRCSYCSCAFRFPSTLTRHLIEQHTGQNKSVT